MADAHLGDQYIECEHYTVLSQNRLDELWPDDDTPVYCYCGDEAEFRARVGFHQKMCEGEEYGWGNSITKDYKVDRCEEHRFDEPNDD